MVEASVVGELAVSVGQADSELADEDAAVFDEAFDFGGFFGAERIGHGQV